MDNNNPGCPGTKLHGILTVVEVYHIECSEALKPSIFTVLALRAIHPVAYPKNLAELNYKSNAGSGFI